MIDRTYEKLLQVRDALLHLHDDDLLVNVNFVREVLSIWETARIIFGEKKIDIST
jgi:hypothetical protein